MAKVENSGGEPIKPLNKPGRGMSECEQCMVTSFDRLTDTFEASAHRWEVIVYPALIAFVILAGYGFYLIYSLTRDVSIVSANMQQIAANMAQITGQMESVANNMAVMRKDVGGMRAEVHNQSIAMGKVVSSMQDVNKSLTIMNASVDDMRRAMGAMNYNVSRPMSFMNSFVPW